MTQKEKIVQLYGNAFYTLLQEMPTEEQPGNQVAFAFAAGHLSQLDTMHPVILKDRKEIMQQQIDLYNRVHNTNITYADFQEAWINIVMGNV